MTVMVHGPWAHGPWTIMVYAWPQQYPTVTSKRRTDLRSCVSEAKFIKESDFDVKSRLAPPKSTEIDETHVSNTENVRRFFFPASKNRKLQII